MPQSTTVVSITRKTSSTGRSNGEFSIIHFNSRSLYSNFEHIKGYLQNISHRFNIIAISETWITENRGVNFELEGYELNYTNRQDKGGGGVALSVDKSLKYKIMDNMTTTVEDLLECITIELCLEGVKNIIISCVYRAPGSSIDLFKDWMENTFTKRKNYRIYLCGDINIDLLNPNDHNATEDFINTMYSLNLVPKITKTLKNYNTYCYSH